MSFTSSRHERIGRKGFTSRHPAVPVALSFCSGFVDVICFLGLFHSFTAFITGTIIILCSELFQFDSLLWLRAVILSTFFLSALVWVPFVKHLVKTGRPAVRLCLGLESLFLGLFLAAAVTLPVTSDLLSPGTTLALIFATVAMSLQNVAMQIVLQFHTPTTVMTGNFMRFVVTTIERFGARHAAGPGGSGDSRAAAPGGQAHYGYSLVAFVAGGVAGAGCHITIGFWGLLAPVLMLAALAIATRD